MKRQDNLYVNTFDFKNNKENSFLCTAKMLFEVLKIS